MEGEQLYLEGNAGRNQSEVSISTPHLHSHRLKIHFDLCTWEGVLTVWTCGRPVVASPVGHPSLAPRSKSRPEQKRVKGNPQDVPLLHRVKTLLPLAKGSDKTRKEEHLFIVPVEHLSLKDNLHLHVQLDTIYSHATTISWGKVALVWLLDGRILLDTKFSHLLASCTNWRW